MPPSKMDEWFKTRWWRVVTEAHGDGFAPCEPDKNGEQEYIPVHFDHGHFTVELPGAFKSPLSGNPGLRGVLLQEVDAGGEDITGSRFPFGEPAVKKAREDYGAIV